MSGSAEVDRRYRETFASELERRYRTAKGNREGADQSRFAVAAIRKRALSGDVRGAAVLCDELVRR